MCLTSSYCNKNLVFCLIPLPPSPGGEGGMNLLYKALAPLPRLASPKRLREGEGRGFGVRLIKLRGVGVRYNLADLVLALQKS